ncbi:hypothetical protein QFC21_002003 [Naganishia friedmannii]|uniref:Uncharacterized protein n=1 Tax=Naganishia friedmannii TaxID=89922 RepID=A0ACC2W1I6_9TREE|nr:hypothetical protein QFC21_002003 [Naganishia friedmannii]
MTIPAIPQDYHLYHDDLPASVVRKDYHRFYLDPTTLPSPRIVGVLACQRDPYLRSLETRILRAEPAGEEAVARSKGVTAQTANGQFVKGDGKEKGKAGKGKTGKGSKGDAVTGKDAGASSGDKKELKNAESREPELWQLELEDTVLFPEGKSDSHTVKLVIQDVFRRGLTALHIVRLATEAQPEERDVTLRALREIQDGRRAPCTVTVDWERRYDQMTQHTAQHLLSAITDTLLGLPTLSWFMPPHPSTEPCYIELPRSLTPAEASAMEAKCNELVTRNWGADEEGQEVRVWIESRLQKRGGASSSSSSPSAPESASGMESTEVGAETTVDKEEAEGLGLLAGGGIQKGEFEAHDEEQKEWADRESRGLPKDYAGGVIRTAVIEGHDRNHIALTFNDLFSTRVRSGGDHHPALSKIGLIHVLPPTNVSQKPTRLFMLAGHRATRHLIAASGELTRAATVVGCSRSELAGRVEQREQGRREMMRGQERMRAELAKVLGGVVVWKTMADGDGKEIRCAVVSRAEEATHDFEFLTALNVAAVDALKADFGNDDGVLPRYALIIHSTVIPAPNNGVSEAGSLVLITTNPPELAKTYGDKLKSALDAIPGQERARVKGGGAKGRWMGKVGGKWSRADAEALEGVVVA